jgi:hypothetical protein
MRLPVVRLSRSFWDDARDGKEEAKLEFVFRKLASIIAWGRITTLELPCKMKGQDAERFAGVLLSAQHWRTLISVAILISEQPRQRGLQECCGSAGSWCTSISVAIKLEQAGQRGLQEFCHSAQRWLTSTSAAIGSALSGKGGFELRDVVKPLVFFCRHLE